MKKFRFMIFVGMALLPLVITSCSSTQNLDLSTLDLSKPIQVGSIYLYINLDENYQPDKFYAKYGEGLRNASDQMQKADADKLLEILCGTVSRNWKSIADRVKAETGITLNGDQFLQDLRSGDSYRIISQKADLLYVHTYFYSWSAMDYEPPVALIGLIYLPTEGTIIPDKISIETWDEGKYGDTSVNKRQTTRSLR
jgi:hypothetical protein